MAGTVRFLRLRSLGCLLQVEAVSAMQRPTRMATRVGWSQRRSYGVSSGAQTTRVEKILLDTTRATGPISYATYMQMCLSHPTEGYYMSSSNSVIGSRGDFTTSPEISQVFGELIATWLLSQYLSLGAAREIRLVELGPGRGTLMDDVLRVISQFSATRSVRRTVHLVETSAPMIEQQKAKLGKHGLDLSWHSSIDEIHPDPSKFHLILAHEFFDALPFHVVQKTEKGWQEVLLTSSPDPPVSREKVKPGAHLTTSLDLDSTLPPKGDSNARFREVLSPTPTPSSTLLGLSSTRFQKMPVGTRVEVSPASFKIARKIAELVHGESKEGPQSAGSALIVDYGGPQAFMNSFRAFKDHKIVDVFHRPGECDLTVNVDFEYLKEASSDLATSYGPLSQARFLTRMGIDLRVKALQKAAPTEERRKEIEDAAKRLVDLTGMGTQYQVMALSGKMQAEPDASQIWPFVELPGAQ